MMKHIHTYQKIRHSTNIAEDQWEYGLILCLHMFPNQAPWVSNTAIIRSPIGGVPGITHNWVAVKYLKYMTKSSNVKLSALSSGVKRSMFKYQLMAWAKHYLWMKVQGVMRCLLLPVLIMGSFIMHEVWKIVSLFLQLPLNWHYQCSVWMLQDKVAVWERCIFQESGNGKSRGRKHAYEKNTKAL